MKSSDFRKIMRQFPAAVSIVTSQHGEQKTGITISSLTSVSLEPPTLLFCINKESASHDIIKKSKSCVINLLSREHIHISNYFAGYISDKTYKGFLDTHWQETDKKVPLLKNAVANFICNVDKIIDTKTHSIFIVHVNGGYLDEKQQAVLYCLKHYGTFESIQ